MVSTLVRSGCADQVETMLDRSMSDAETVSLPETATVMVVGAGVDTAAFCDSDRRCPRRLQRLRR